MGFQKEVSDQIVVALRRIIRAVDLHSRRLAQEFGLTGPQVVLLRALVRQGEMHVAELAKDVNLSHATVTDILNRLEKRGLVERTRSLVDRRRILVTPTLKAISLIEQSPPLLHEQFSDRLERLQNWELSQILSVLQRVALMMDAQEVEASPLLATGSMTAEPEMVEEVTRAESGAEIDEILDVVIEPPLHASCDDQNAAR
jgi:DNA-binding MarR family transcriptional regulator